MDTATHPVELATDLTIAWLGNPHTRTSGEDVPAFLKAMHDAIANLSAPAAADPDAAQPGEHAPAVTVRKSLASPDHILSMIDGKPYRTLRRHLSTNGLTPDEYRARYNLKADYPMVAASYSEARRTMAKAIGLGRKAGHKVEAVVEDAVEPVVKAVRKGGKAALAAAKDALGTGD